MDKCRGDTPPPHSLETLIKRRDRRLRGPEGCIQYVCMGTYRSGFIGGTKINKRRRASRERGIEVEKTNFSQRKEG